MESSVRPELYRDLADWGYGLIRFEKRADPGELLRELVKTDEVRVREIAFNEALSELFADRQAEIVRKILARQALTKTEREYFSRVIKKRLAAIANPDMQTLATSLAGRPDAFIKSALNVADED